MENCGRNEGPLTLHTLLEVPTSIHLDGFCGLIGCNPSRQKMLDTVALLAGWSVLVSGRSFPSFAPCHLRHVVWYFCILVRYCEVFCGAR